MPRMQRTIRRPPMVEPLRLRNVSTTETMRPRHPDHGALLAMLPALPFAVYASRCKVMYHTGDGVPSNHRLSLGSELVTIRLGVTDCNEKDATLRHETDP